MTAQKVIDRETAGQGVSVRETVGQKVTDQEVTDRETASRGVAGREMRGMEIDAWKCPGKWQDIE